MSKQNRNKLLVDLGAFIAFLISMNPRSSGTTVHEWLAISLGGVIIVHLLLNWNWIAEISSRFFRRAGGNSRLNYILNWLMFIDGVLIMLSGIMISRSVMPFFGITMPANFAWRGLHDTSANLFLVVLGLHLALHWSWIKNTIKRLLAQKESRPAFINRAIGKDAQV